MTDLDASAAASETKDPLAVPYQSLYRRYRPQRFDEVRGQDHITRALRNAVRDQKVAHAYLFSGPRGTGKTSTARILAMALNCADPIEGEPDGVCDSCVEIRRGSSLDVHELDAASNRKLDEMRDLLGRVALGTRGRWKVYIVDEVHQLTPDAASALLKTLEEPPAHVVFVLATTDPQKVLPTIRSRTQHFEFRLLSTEVLGQLLHDVNAKAALGVAPEAIDLVVRRGHGSARDALSVLDQVAAAGEVESEAGVIADITDALAEADAARVLTAVAEGISAGRDPRRLAADLLDHLRNGFLALQARQLVLLPDDAAAEVEAQARRLGLPSVVRALEVIGQALVDMRDSVDSRITLEVALVRLSQPRADTSVAALTERVDQLERRLREIDRPPGPGAGSPGPGGSPPGDPSLHPEPGSSPSSRPSAMPPETSASAAGGAGRSFPRPAPRPGPRPGPAAPRPAAPGPAAGPPPEAAPPPPARTAARSALGAHRKAPGGSPPSGVEPTPLPPPVPSGGPPGAPGGLSPSPIRASEPPRASRPSAPPAGPRPSPPAGPRSSPPANARTSGPSAPPGGPRSSPPANARTSGPPGPPATPRPSPPATTREAGRPPSSPPPSGRPASDPGSSPPGQRPMPSRDDITEAWADAVLPKLRVPARAFLASGRFQSAEDGLAVFAVPDRPLLERAASVKGEAEAALSAHFGRPIMMRLVHDRGAAPPVPGLGEDSAGEDPADYDLDDLDDATTAVVSPEERLLRAFPGAEEVDP